MRPRFVLVVVACAVLCASEEGARAAGPAEDPKVAEAREQFVRGAGFVKSLQYADALAAFERSATLRPHPATTYNIGACQRAMGQYTLARKTLTLALKQGDGGELSEGLRAEARGFLRQIDSVLASADVTLAPADAGIAVDGRPLEVGETVDGKVTLTAGTRPPGPAEPPPAARFRLSLDPGAHVITIASKGFANAVVNRAFNPGSSTSLELSLDKLPATVHIASREVGAVVGIDGVDVGVTPVAVERPAGHYRVVVKRQGYEPYETEVVAHPGERVDLMASLKQERIALTQRWWFWTAASVVVAGAVVGTYYATRPAPERPPLNGGGLGWTLQAQ